MEWPHDPDGEHGSEGGRAYGQAIFAKKVADESFPLDFAEFNEQIGHHPIRIDHETVVAAADILEYVEADEAEDLISFQQLVGDAMRRGGFWPYEITG